MLIFERIGDLPSITLKQSQRQTREAAGGLGVHEIRKGPPVDMPPHTRILTHTDVTYAVYGRSLRGCPVARDKNTHASPYVRALPHTLALYLLNDAVYLRIFIYKGTKTKLGSVCRAHQMQSNGPTLRSLANFHIELEPFCCSLTAA